MLADSVAGELIESEIEIRSGRGENFADAVGSSGRRAPRLFALAADRGALLAPPARTRGARGRSSGSSTPSTTAACTTASSTSRGATTPSALHVHVGVQRRRPGGRRLRPPAAGAAGAAGAVGQLAVPRRPRLAGCTRRARRSSRRASRAAGSRTPFGELARLRRLRRLPACARTRSSSTRSSGGACARTTRSAPSSCASATPRRAPSDSTALAGLITACVAQAALDTTRACRSRPPRRADRGELLAGDPLRARRQADRPRPGRGVPGGGRDGRQAARVDGAGAGGARHRSRRYRSRTAPSASSALADGAMRKTSMPPRWRSLNAPTRPRRWPRERGPAPGGAEEAARRGRAASDRRDADRPGGPQARPCRGRARSTSIRRSSRSISSGRSSRRCPRSSGPLCAARSRSSRWPTRVRRRAPPPPRRSRRSRTRSRPTTPSARRPLEALGPRRGPSRSGGPRSPGVDCPRSLSASAPHAASPRHGFQPLRRILL